MAENESRIEITKQEYDEYLLLKGEKENPTSIDLREIENDINEVKKFLGLGIKGEANKFAMKLYYSLRLNMEVGKAFIRDRDVLENQKRELEELKKLNESYSSDNFRLKGKIDELEDELRKLKRGKDESGNEEDEETEYPYY